MRILKIVALLWVTLLYGCVQETASVNDLVFHSGISNSRIMLDGTEGVSSTFSFKANHDWNIIDYKGFSCYPSSGHRTAEGEVEVVTVKPLKSNNSADTIRLSDLNFKMLSTRFVGISAYQLPQILLPKGDSAIIDAVEGSTTTFKFVSRAEDIILVPSGNISVVLGDKNSKNEYTITITATQDNNTPTSQVIGSIGFKVDGVTQESKIEVIQASAIILDRSEVLLPGVAGGENMLIVNSEFDIEVSTDSSLFEVVLNSDKSMVVKAKIDNTTSEIASLGSIEVSLTNAPQCRTSIEVKQRKAKAPQTIIIHFIGTALQYYFNSNLNKILEALNKNIQGDAQIMAITTDTINDATLYELRYDSTIGKSVKEMVKKLSLPTPYNDALFENNLREALNFAPADRYALVIGSHGLGWVLKQTSSDVSKYLMRMGLTSYTLWERNQNAEMTRHVGDKKTTQYNISEISSAIKANGIKFDYILFDACFMGNIESVYELRNTTDYIIGSPCEVMGYGFPYSKVMPYMLTENGTSYNLDKICSEYVDYYKTEAVTHSACVALTATAELEALATAMKAVNAATIKEDFLLQNVQYYEGQDPHSFYDLGDMVEQSCADVEAAAAFKAQLDKTVTSRYHTTQFYSAYGSGNKYYHDINYYSGISTSAMVRHYATDWQQTEWYKATH